VKMTGSAPWTIFVATTTAKIFGMMLFLLQIAAYQRSSWSEDQVPTKETS